MQDGDLVGMLFDERLEGADVGVARRRGGVVAALAERPGGRPHLLFELHAERFEPVDRVEGVVGEVMDELGRALLMAAFVRGLVELLDGVLDALFLLALGVDCVERSFRDVRRAARDAAFLHHDHLGARLGGGDGRREPRAAGPDDAHVGIVGRLYAVVRSGGGFERVCGARLLGAIPHALLQAHAGQRGAGDRVDVERLILDDLVRKRFKRRSAHAERFLARGGVDGGDGAFRERHVDGERGVVAGDVGGVRARLPALRRASRARFRARRCAPCEAEAHRGAADADECRALQERPAGDAASLEQRRAACGTVLRDRFERVAVARIPHVRSLLRPLRGHSVLPTARNRRSGEDAGTRRKGYSPVSKRYFLRVWADGMRSGCLVSPLARRGAGFSVEPTAVGREFAFSLPTAVDAGPRSSDLWFGPLLGR